MSSLPNILVTFGGIFFLSMLVVFIGGVFKIRARHGLLRLL